MFVMLDDSSECDIARVVVNFPPTSAEDVVFVEFDNGAAIAWFDHYTGRGDGPSFCTGHDYMKIYLTEDCF